MNPEEAYHIPVLLTESVEALEIDPDGIYVDATFGGGGHAKAILAKLNKGRLIAFDQDPDAAGNVPDDERLIFVPQNFRYMRNYLKALNAIPVSGILADLGVSSHQFDTASRGFSIRADAPLDMRMSSRGTLTAARIIETYPQEKLAEIFRMYGEISGAGRIAARLVQRRSEEEINTTGKLMELLASFAPRNKAHKFYAQIFQALRIEVNGELESLRQLLLQSNEVLKSKGRMVVISYHSLEDRLVKNYFKRGVFTGEEPKDFYGRSLRPFDVVYGKPIVPDAGETARNPRARSAKMRVAVKK